MSETLRTGSKPVKVTLFDVFEWPEVDASYNHVLLRLPGGYEARLSMADGQRLGHRLNDAAGGSLHERRPEVVEQTFSETDPEDNR